MRRPRRSGERVSLVSWLNGRFAARAPFTDPEGRKGLWTWFTRARRHRVTAYEVELPGLGPRPWRVALLADLHVGGHAGDVARLRTLVAQTNALAPDLVLLLGDYLNMMPFGGGRVPPETIASLLAGLRAPAGVLGVLGNHDWRYGRDEVVRVFTQAGLSLIDNRVVLVTRGEDRLAVLGLEDDRWGSPDMGLFDVLPSGCPALVATHDPGLFRDLPPGHVVVAGHMHGGQIRWPSLPALAVPSGRAPRRWAHGVIREKGSTLVVSAGLGVSGLPLRLGMPPEVVILTLVGPEASSPRNPRPA